MLKPRFADRLYAEEERTRATAQLAYLSHLQALDFSRSQALITYFGFDFFHDGKIDEIAFSPDLRTITWRCATTWIRPRDPEQLRVRGYLWANFRCTFEDVVWFQTSGERVDRLNDPLGGPRSPIEFRASEVDTLDRELQFYRRNFRAYLREREATLHSLLIDLAPAPGRLGMIFRQVDVWPEEPVAWEQLVASGQYDIPWCHPPDATLAAQQARLKEELKSPAA